MTPKEGDLGSQWGGGTVTKAKPVGWWGDPAEEWGEPGRSRRAGFGGNPLLAPYEAIPGRLSLGPIPNPQRREPFVRGFNEASLPAQTRKRSTTVAGGGRPMGTEPLALLLPPHLWRLRFLCQGCASLFGLSWKKGAGGWGVFLGRGGSLVPLISRGVSEESLPRVVASRLGLPRWKLSRALLVADTSQPALSKPLEIFGRGFGSQEEVVWHGGGGVSHPHVRAFRAGLPERGRQRCSRSAQSLFPVPWPWGMPEEAEKTKLAEGVSGRRRGRNPWDFGNAGAGSRR